MKKLLSLVLLVALVFSLSMVSQAEEVSPVVREKALDYFANYHGAKYVIKVTDLFAKMDAGEDMLILDIRQPDAYAQGHLIGAVNVPYGLTIADSLSLIPDDVQLYIYCYTGQTSSQTTALLNVAGKYAANIQSGFNNGISTTEGYEAYVTTDVAELPGDSYDVDPDVQAAITKYFEDMESKAGTAFANFNFKPESLQEVLDAELDDYFVYSVRRAEDFAAGHIQSAINNPYGAGMERPAQGQEDHRVLLHGTNRLPDPCHPAAPGL
ncbi:MAG TPA: rhodanese-like domain-containing protein [Clostridia bacterium]|nr:rhodanese-like domain-containing protein [Clostridia bacterium]